MQNGLNSEDLEVLELLRGVHSEELRKELLKEKEPKIKKLLKIAHESVQRIEMDQNFNSASNACGAKAKDQSDYRKDKAEGQQQKAQDVAASKAVGSNLPKSGPKENKRICYSCGIPIKDIKYFGGHRKKECPGQDKKCNRYAKQGFLVLPCKDVSKKAYSVRLPSSYRAKAKAEVELDNVQTPNIKEFRFEL